MRKLFLDEITKLTSVLPVAFEWADTPQGTDYWSEVLGNLRDLRQQAEEQIAKREDLLREIGNLTAEQRATLRQGRTIQSKETARLKNLMEKL